MLLFTHKQTRKNVGVITISIFLLLGIIVGNPNILTDTGHYLYGYSMMMGAFSRPAHDIAGMHFLDRWVGLVNYLIQIIYGMGIPFSLFTLLGCVAWCAKKGQGFEKLVIGSLVFFTGALLV